MSEQISHRIDEGDVKKLLIALYNLLDLGYVKGAKDVIASFMRNSLSTEVRT